jgi:DNA replication protein DnaC
MDVLDCLPVHKQEVNPKQAEDYVGEDGLLVCGNCGGKKQIRLKMLDREFLAPCLCECESKRREEEEKERKYQEEMRRIALLKEMSLMSDIFRNASFGAYTIREENRKVHKIATTYVEKFDEMKEKNQGLIFYGPVGTGKSYTAACIANALLDKSVSVVMTSFVKILQEIRSVEDEGKYVKMLNAPSLLIIDDLGAERNTDYALEKVYNIIDSRVREAKPMILTTNLDIKEMRQTMDIRYSRIYDRIFECCYPVGVYGKSFRIMQAASRYEEMERMLLSE